MINIKTYIKAGLSASEVSQLTSIPIRRVHYIANKNNLYFKRKSKYNLNYNRFSKQLHTEETYYLLGYLYADGYVNPNKGLINITSKDKEILEKLVFLIGDIPIKENNSFYNIQWYSKKHIQQLIDLGCYNKKSLILEYPNWLHKDLEHHFIRGYFDGDGSIGLYNRTGKDKRPSKVLKVNIAGTKNFLKGIKNYINNKGSISKTSSIYLLQYSGNTSSSIFCEKIYENSTLYMERKHDVYFRGFIPYRYFIDNNIEL